MKVSGKGPTNLKWEKASQVNNFKEAARQLDADEDPERFKETVRKLVSAPVTRNGPSKAKEPKP